MKGFTYWIGVVFFIYKLEIFNKLAKNMENYEKINIFDDLNKKMFHVEHFFIVFLKILLKGFYKL